jgi:cytochrome c553
MTRVPIDDGVAAEVMFLHGRICCVCNIPDKAVQIHHIDEDPSNGERSNLAVLCLECHEKTQIRGGFGRKLRAPEVIKHRDEWLRRIADRRDKADQLVISKMAVDAYSQAQPEAQPEEWSRDWEPPPEHALLALINALPDIRAAAYEKARPDLANSTLEMKVSSWAITDVLEKSMVLLAAWYPPRHFGKPAEQYFSEYLSGRSNWHHTVNSPDGPMSGTIVGIIAASAMLSDAEAAIEYIVETLAPSRLQEFDLEAWRKRWKDSSKAGAISA